VPDRFEPLFARYDAPRVRPVLAQAIAQGVRSFQALFARLSVAELALEPGERSALRDWDRPEDVPQALRAALAETTRREQ
jgi:molybdopterin-guanine dinucleotide biosynthesis protein A